jgi:hypothetical protein
VFEGDAAIVELRSRLAQTRDGMLLAPAHDPAVPARDSAVRFIGIVVMATAVACAAGYLVGGVKLSARHPPSANNGLPPAPLVPAVNRQSPARNSARPVPPPAAIDVASAATHPSADGAVTAGAAPRPVPISASPPPPDASVIAAKFKLGTDLMTAGDIASARTMFERVAEAGDAAGAFALAETYDPAALKTLHLRGGITSDPAQARRWYEKAREMGSTAAAERIGRLTGDAR